MNGAHTPARRYGAVPAVLAALALAAVASLAPMHGGDIPVSPDSFPLYESAPARDSTMPAAHLPYQSLLLPSAHADEITGVATPNANGTYGTGRILNITVAFDEAVNVTGTPVLALNTEPPRNASYVGGSGTDTLTFAYAVLPGDRTPPPF